MGGAQGSSRYEGHPQHTALDHAHTTDPRSRNASRSKSFKNIFTWRRKKSDPARARDQNVMELGGHFDKKHYENGYNWADPHYNDGRYIFPSRRYVELMRPKDLKLVLENLGLPTEGSRSMLVERIIDCEDVTFGNAPAQSPRPLTGISKQPLVLQDEDEIEPIHVASKNGHFNAVRLLISQGVDLDSRAQDGSTALSLSAQHGHRDLVVMLIRNKANINTQRRDGATPLHLACASSHRRIALHLIRRRAKVDMQWQGGATPIIVAAANGLSKVVAKLISIVGNQVNESLNDGATPLYLAAEGGHLATVQKLLEHGSVEVNSNLKSGASPLYIACQNNHPDIAKILLEANAKVNAGRTDGATALYIASENGHLQIVTLLLDFGASQLSLVNNYATPLYIASQNGHSRVAKTLIEAQANVDVRRRDRVTPLIIASANGHEETIAVLLIKKANIHSVQVDGASPLLVACEFGHPMCVDLLISRHADIHQARNDNTTPLFAAIENNHADIVRRLIRARASVTASRVDGTDPLICASANRSERLVRLLLLHKASPKLRSKTGNTALHEACNAGNERIVKCLLNKKALVNARRHDGVAPIYLATKKGFTKIAKLLIIEKADVHGFGRSMPIMHSELNERKHRITPESEGEGQIMQPSKMGTDGYHQAQGFDPDSPSPNEADVEVIPEREITIERPSAPASDEDNDEHEDLRAVASNQRVHHQRAQQEDMEQKNLIDSDNDMILAEAPPIENKYGGQRKYDGEGSKNEVNYGGRIAATAKDPTEERAMDVHFDDLADDDESDALTADLHPRYQHKKKPIKPPKHASIKNDQSNQKPPRPALNSTKSDSANPKLNRSYAIVRDNNSGSFQSGNHSRQSSQHKYSDNSYSEAKHRNQDRSIAIMRSPQGETNGSGQSSMREKQLNRSYGKYISSSEFDPLTPANAKKALGVIPSPADDTVFAFTSQHIAKAGKPKYETQAAGNLESKPEAKSGDSVSVPPVSRSRKSSTGRSHPSRSRRSRSYQSRSKDIDPNAETLESHGLQARSTTKDLNADTLDSNSLQPHSRIISKILGSDDKSERMSLMSRSNRSEGEALSIMEENDYYALPESKEARKLKDRYVVSKELGRGAYAAVLEALDLETKQVVAVKIARRDRLFYQHAEEEYRLIREVQSPKKCDSIIDLLDGFAHGGHYCIVMAKLSMNLYELNVSVKCNGFSLDLVRLFGRQLLLALERLHSKKILHRDIKPENMLLACEESAHIKLVDFGSAVPDDKDPNHGDYVQSRFYRSPEVILGLEQSPAMDMWSLGCNLYEFHTGLPLFPGKNELDMLTKMIATLGMPPASMIQEGKLSGKHFARDRATDGRFVYSLLVEEEDVEDFMPGALPLSTLLSEIQQENRRRPGHSGRDYVEFVDVVQRMLAFEPSKRISPEEALSHPFFAKTNPKMYDNIPPLWANDDYKASSRPVSSRTKSKSKSKTSKAKTEGSVSRRSVSMNFRNGEQHSSQASLKPLDGPPIQKSSGEAKERERSKSKQQADPNSMMEGTLDFSQNISSHSSLFSMSGPDSGKRDSASQKYLGQPKEGRPRLGSASSGGLLHVSSNTLPSVSEIQEGKDDIDNHTMAESQALPSFANEHPDPRRANEAFGDNDSEDSFASNDRGHVGGGRRTQPESRNAYPVGENVENKDGGIHQFSQSDSEDDNMGDAYEDGDRVLASNRSEDFMEV
eukprot:CAMPEP_0114505108 /NCGR_PEP_ID=MMETSP0109-20121206/10666_1 /TAXON_ID=29199 /ORGANISM="Chlorarachnion reptans, Strain CCCM449" /LENGTH=1710 /DNA_ID=CAMNT_0001683503 /DNA_START=213 /DNA_END=5345 /DNA_ORIENTATION=+